MRSFLVVLALAVAALAAAGWKPPRAPEIDRTTAVAEAVHRAAKKWTMQRQREFRRHGWDAWEACAKRAKVYGLNPVWLYRVYAAIAFVEARWKVMVSHDNGDGWGTIGMQEGSVVAAARRLGILGKNPTSEQRRKVWERFHRDPQFVVLVGVEHVAWVVAGKKDILPPIVKHNCYRCGELATNAEKYGGSVLYWHRLLWRENLPFTLAAGADPEVGSGLQSSSPETGGTR